MNPQKIIQELEQEEELWKVEIAGEKLSGNIVKEERAKGVVMGLRIALGELRRAAEAPNTEMSRERSSSGPASGSAPISTP